MDVHHIGACQRCVSYSRKECHYCTGRHTRRESGWAICRFEHVVLDDAVRAEGVVKHTAERLTETNEPSSVAEQMSLGSGSSKGHAHTKGLSVT
jgi:hypothetical protein